jgi:hypothetical protein
MQDGCAAAAQVLHEAEMKLKRIAPHAADDA